MRVGYLTYGLDRAPAGIGRYAVELLRGLAALPDAPELILLTTEQKDRHGLWGDFERYALHGCRLLPGLMSLGNLALSIAAQRLKLDIIHDPNGIAPFWGPCCGARRVVSIHDAFAYVCPEAHNRLDNWRFRAFLPQMVRRADLTLTDSRNSASDLKRYLAVPETKLRTIPLGISEHFRPFPDSSARREVLARYQVTSPYLLYVGGINARKNIGRVFEAYARIRERYPQLHLVIAGQRQWQTAEIDAAYRRLGLERHVCFTGYIDDADLPALYSAAEAFVFPSLHEGFGFPLLEAMACGVPVITSNVSSLPEVVGDAALTINPYDVASLTRAIERVLNDAVLWAELRRRGLERVQQFTWKRTAYQTLSAYMQVLDRDAVDCAGPASSVLGKERNHEY